VLDFKELPVDGTAFEQLMRELLLGEGLAPYWTGKGADGGRDLLVEEAATGQLGSFQRKWLVSCKHKAHSGAAVSVGDIPSVLDDCKRVNADGYLLACSTYPSSGVVQKLDELAGEPANRLRTVVWDAVEIEKRLMQPTAFALTQLFFPKATAASPWRIYNMGSPGRFAAHYKGYFIYLSSRISAHFPDLREVGEIVARLESVTTGEGEEIRPRAVYFDEKHEQFMVFADYLVPRNIEPSLSPTDINAVLHDGTGLHHNDEAEWYLTGWDIRLVRTLPWSERYQPDDRGFYDSSMPKFEIGRQRGPTIGELSTWDD
jgi:hypothetical protein